MERTTRGGFLKAARMVERTPDSRSAFHNPPFTILDPIRPPLDLMAENQPTRAPVLGFEVRGSRFEVASRSIMLEE